MLPKLFISFYCFLEPLACCDNGAVVATFCYNTWHAAQILQGLLLIITVGGSLHQLYSSCYSFLQQLQCCTYCTVASNVCYNMWHAAQIVH